MVGLICKVVSGRLIAMMIFLPVLAITFTAFCVWLTVRIVNKHERWAMWTLAMTLSVPMLYAASFGPAVWLATRFTGDRNFIGRSLGQVYRPLAYCPKDNALGDAYEAYCDWWLWASDWNPHYMDP